ncbi:MAG: hypothetical protein WCO84_07275 [bacterium]
MTYFKCPNCNWADTPKSFGVVGWGDMDEDAFHPKITLHVCGGCSAVFLDPEIATKKAESRVRQKMQGDRMRESRARHNKIQHED